MKTLTIDDIPRHDGAINLPNGFRIEVKTEYDHSHGAPWEECDGHGPVSEWTRRDKRPGERVLCSQRSQKRYYDFAQAVRIARRDNWDTAPYRSTFPSETKGQKAVRAVEADFKFLSDWANNQWQYIGVVVRLEDSEGRELAEESLWGVESFGNYWREVAAELGNLILAQYFKEEIERAYWEARDVLTQ